MSQRLNAWSQRFKTAVLRVGSYVLIVLLTLLLLVPNAVSEFVMVFPGLLRLGAVGLMYAFILAFYPQFRFWTWRKKHEAAVSRTVDQSHDRIRDRMAEPPSVVDEPPVEAESRQKPPRLTLPPESPVGPQVPQVDPSTTEESTEEESVGTPPPATARPSARLLEETPDIQLADWMEDKGDADDDDDFWSMLSDSTKDTDQTNGKNS